MIISNNRFCANRTRSTTIKNYPDFRKKKRERFSVSYALRTRHNILIYSFLLLFYIIKEKSEICAHWTELSPLHEPALFQRCPLSMSEVCTDMSSTGFQSVALNVYRFKSAI